LLKPRNGIWTRNSIANNALARPFDLIEITDHVGCRGLD
jgi:hypothetical protein